MHTINRKKDIPSNHFFLFGPRGTGKTTWLKNNFSDAPYLDLLKPDLYLELLASPQNLESLAEAHRNQVIIIDEIQRIPGLLPVIHRCIEKNIARQFIMTGSSARKLRHTETDLLGGRAAPEYMPPFIASELKAEFDEARSLKFGMLPLVYGAGDPAAILRGYTGVYLEQEVKAEAAVRNIDSFARFLTVLSFSQAQVLNLSEISRECQVRRSTVDLYLEIVRDLLIADLLPVFTRRAKRTLSVHPKFYFFDCGVYRHLRPSGPLDQPSEIDGAALETLVYQHLRAWIDNGNPEHELSFWRTRNKVEVDFIVYGGNTFLAIEVKNTRKVRSKDLKGLRAFHAEFPQATLLFLYRGELKTMAEQVHVMPVSRFLLHLDPSQPIKVALQ
ncbi:MAG: ATP-binding protein [Spirochaetales bacterium]|nr:ATP-binding protein [Spirochaetales bacterium]